MLTPNPNECNSTLTRGTSSIYPYPLYRVSHKKGIDKKLLFGAAQGLNLQFLNLFEFSISVSFVWCII